MPHYIWSQAFINYCLAKKVNLDHLPDVVQAYIEYHNEKGLCALCGHIKERCQCPHIKRRLRVLGNSQGGF